MTLEKTGCNSKVTSTLKPKFSKYMDDVVKDVAGSDDDCCDDQPETETGSGAVSGHSGVWWIGGVYITASYDCSVNCSGGGTIKDYDCSFDFEMDDAFEKPTDLNNDGKRGPQWFDRGDLEFGKVFNVTHTWTDSRKGTL